MTRRLSTHRALWLAIGITIVGGLLLLAAIWGNPGS